MTVDLTMKFSKELDEAIEWTKTLIGETPEYHAARLLVAEVIRLREQNDALSLIADTAVTEMDGWQERAEAAEAEVQSLMEETNLLTHKIITCGVAASHTNANLTCTGAYAGKWDSPQAEEVRNLRKRAEAAERERDRYREDRNLEKQIRKQAEGQREVFRGALGDVLEIGEVSATVRAIINRALEVQP